RTSMAATLRIPFARVDDWPASLGDLRRSGFSLVALTPREPSDDLDRFAARGRPPKLALVAGTEGAGLTDAVERMADCRVRIAIAREVDSLNVAVAVGIALHRLQEGPPIKTSAAPRAPRAGPRPPTSA